MQHGVGTYRPEIVGLAWPEVRAILVAVVLYEIVRHGLHVAGIWKKP